MWDLLSNVGMGASLSRLSLSSNPMPLIIPAASARGVGPEILGGKGAQLAILGELGARVPDWFALPTDGCASALNGEGLSAQVESELLAAYDRLAPDGAKVAVRSSADVEDSAGASFAGQLESYLFVSRDQLLARVRDCIASAVSQRAIKYRELQRIAAPVRVAVVVQRMIDPVASGVVFTANPTSGSRQEAVVSAAWGVGEGVVLGTADCDTWYVELATGAVLRRQLTHKRLQIQSDAQGGTRSVAVPAEKALVPALEDAQVAALVSLARRVAEARGAPQDLEWALAGDGQLSLLQTRPITTLGAPPSAGTELIFDNANVVESYPGVTSPLTFSFIQDAYARTFRSAARRFGIPPALIAANDALFENLVASLEGRVYYNLLNWYRLYQLVPGFEGRLEAWEKALGLEHREVPRGGGRLRALPARLQVVRRILGQLFTLRRDAEQFARTLNAEFARQARVPLESLDAHALLAALEELGAAIYEPFGLTLVNDFYAQQAYEGVGKLIERWNLGEVSDTRNALFCGQGTLESIAPARSVVRISEQIGESPEARSLFLSDQTEQQLWAAVQQEPRWEFIRAAFAQHLEAFGDRTLHELKLETASLREDPALLVASVRNCLRGGKKIAGLDDHEKQGREDGERRIAAALKGHPFRAAIFLRVLELARRGVANRESMRLSRTRAYGTAKRIYRALGQRLVEAGLIAGVEEVFFLTTQEVAGAVRGHGATSNLKALVALRRNEGQAQQTRRLPGRIVTRGVVAGARLAEEAPLLPRIGARTLQGTGCSRGIVRAPAKVVLEPRSDLRVDGEILIAPMTDPGWVLLMVSAAGIVSERGSLLSHTAIVGRELGIPTVVGVPDATRLIATGDPVQLDGAAGTVTVLEASK